MAVEDSHGLVRATFLRVTDSRSVPFVSAGSETGAPAFAKASAWQGATDSTRHGFKGGNLAKLKPIKVDQGENFLKKKGEQDELVDCSRIQAAGLEQVFQRDEIHIEQTNVCLPGKKP